MTLRILDEPVPRRQPFDRPLDEDPERGAVERRSDPNDRRVKALLLTAEGERLRARFWHDLVEDPGPLAPLGENDLRTLASLLEAVDPDAESVAN